METPHEITVDRIVRRMWAVNHATRTDPNWWWRRKERRARRRLRRALVLAMNFDGAMDEALMRYVKELAGFDLLVEFACGPMGAGDMQRTQQRLADLAAASTPAELRAILGPPEREAA
ncbi:hypothetical protein ACFC26_36440 [Kitasatospora purpeofusca]|uniref:hypothetical protein n=1 Tax=Kitasatospora purpeofusca TaxID=67352 RepID=UPI0035DC1075